MPRPPNPCRGGDQEFFRTLGRILQRVRRERKVKSFTIQMELNVSETTISNWETGKNAISLQHLRDLSRVLGVEASTLLSMAEKYTQARKVMTGHSRRIQEEERAGE